MAQVNDIFTSPVPSGLVVASQQVVLGQPLHTHQALTDGNAAATANLLDSAVISEGARVAADDTALKIAALTGSANGPAGIPAVHPVINGIAEIRQSANTLAETSPLL